MALKIGDEITNECQPVDNIPFFQVGQSLTGVTPVLGKGSGRDDQPSLNKELDDYAASDLNDEDLVICNENFQQKGTPLILSLKSIQEPNGIKSWHQLGSGIYSYLTGQEYTVCERYFALRVVRSPFDNSVWCLRTHLIAEQWRVVKWARDGIPILGDPVQTGSTLCGFSHHDWGAWINIEDIEGTMIPGGELIAIPDYIDYQGGSNDLLFHGNCPLSGDGFSHEETVIIYYTTNNDWSHVVPPDQLGDTDSTIIVQPTVFDCGNHSDPRPDESCQTLQG